MFIDYYRRQNKSNMEKSLFLGFDEINGGGNKEEIVKKIIQELEEELNGDTSQLPIIFRIKEQSMGINRLKDEILFKKDIFDLLHLGTGEDKQKKIITKNTKHKLLYQLYSTVQESDIDNRLTAMEQEIEKSNTTSEEIAYLKRKIKNAEGNYYNALKADLNFNEIIKKIEQHQDDGESDMVGDFAHMTRNRVVHKIYKTENEGMQIVDTIIKNMDEQEMQYMLARLKIKHQDVFRKVTDFDKNIYKKISNKLLAHSNH